MKILIIGAGPAAWASCLVLRQQGLVPHVWDIGARADPASAALKQALLGQTTRTIDPATEDRLYNPVKPPGSKFPRKTLYGSSWFQPQNWPGRPVLAPDSMILPSVAQGGLSVGWGGACLPIHADDMQDWPVTRADLQDGVDLITRHMPLTGHDNPAAPDRQAFALPDDPLYGTLPISDRMRRIGERLDRNQPDNFCQPARLALHTATDDPALCRQCGLCLTGCPHESIFSIAGQIRQMATAGQIIYQPERLVTGLQQTEDGIRIAWQDITGTRHHDRFDKVILAAGALGSSQLVLSSLGLTDTSLILKDSQKFALPIFTTSHARKGQPVFELPSLFLDRKIGDHWVHVQLNEGGRFARSQLPGFIPAPLRQKLMDHMLVGWGGFHSATSGHFRLSLLRAHRENKPVFHIQPVAADPAARKTQRHVIAVISRQLRAAGLGAIGPLAQMAPPGGGFHFGASLAMTDKAARPTDTDIWGRLPGWNNLHIVDSAVLPSIPATTVAMTIMANAARITRQAISL